MSESIYMSRAKALGLARTSADDEERSRDRSNPHIIGSMKVVIGAKRCA